MNNASMQEVVNHTINEYASEWQLPVSMLTGRDPKTEQGKIDIYEYAEIVRKPCVLALCQRLQAAAIKCDDYHVFVSYSPHVSLLSVYVERTDTDYEDADRVIDRIIDERVFMEFDSGLEKLTALVDQLQRLGVDV